ncbi:MAG: 3-phosphoserine/phosphohydroxythreonine transaminase, partial [Spirochaetota bacterium]
SIVASSEDENFSYIPEIRSGMIRPDADYFYIVSNNTIYGTRYASFPDTGTVPLVADMSSNILSEPVDVSKFGIIFAGAQKNIGPAGLTVVIIRNDLVGNAPEKLPTMFNYQTHVDARSMFNTPPTYAVYIAGLVFKKLLNDGGLEEMRRYNVEKSSLLYDFLDESTLFTATVDKKDRSLMNVPFVTGSSELDAAFIKAAAEQGLVNLKGHRSVGGMRASIYNAMPIDGVKKLVEFMKTFETQQK